MKLSRIESIATHSIGEAVVEEALAGIAGGHMNCTTPLKGKGKTTYALTVGPSNPIC